PRGSLVVDGGGGSSAIAVLAMGGIVLGKSIPIGGFDMDGAIQRHVKRLYGVTIGDRAAERIKIDVGSAYPASDAREAEVRGRDMGTGMQAIVNLAPGVVREGIADVVDGID